MAMMHKYCSKLQNPKIKFKQIKENQLFHFTDYLLTPNDSGADAILKWFKQNPGEFNIIMVCMTVEVFNAIDVQRR